MMDITNMIRFIFPISFVLITFSIPSVFSQEAAPLAPLMESDDKNSLMDTLKGDLLRRYQGALAKDKKKETSHSPKRPRPELGKGQFSEEPIDISKYIGTEGDPEKTIDKLRELGKIPPPKEAAPPPSASDTQNGIWSNIPPEKRYSYAQDLFQRRKYEEAQRELEQFLNGKISNDERFSALVLREKCLYHRRFYDTVQNDYFRLRSFFPDQEKELDELKQYLEDKSGLVPLQQKVFENPTDPVSQHALLTTYENLAWFDFGEEFFLKTIKDTSITTAKSLCEIYFKKQDYEMLVTLSQAARDLHPQEIAFLYNEAVGLYMLGDPASKERALELFQKVSLEAAAPHLRKNAQWYIDRLTSRRGK